MKTKEYCIHGGNTYDIRNELKALGCTWDSKNKMWKTAQLIKSGFTYKRIKSLVESYGCNFVPSDDHLSEEEQKVQKILRGK